MKDKNDIRKTTILTTIVCIIPVLVGLCLYPSLPDTIVIHWGMEGEPNGWSQKFTGVVLFPGLLVLVNLLMPAILKTDPKYANISPKVRNVIHWIIPIVSIFCSGYTLAYALGYDLKIQFIGPMLVGLLFVVTGNYLPKTHQSYTTGIKLPWTLNNEENWNRTHRLAGFLWVICGILMILSAFFPGSVQLIPALFVICVGVPTIYSYLLYKKGM